MLSDRVLGILQSKHGSLDHCRGHLESDGRNISVHAHLSTIRRWLHLLSMLLLLGLWSLLRGTSNLECVRPELLLQLLLLLLVLEKLGLSHVLTHLHMELLVPCLFTHQPTLLLLQLLRTKLLRTLLLQRLLLTQLLLQNPVSVHASLLLLLSDHHPLLLLLLLLLSLHLRLDSGVELRV